DRQHRVTRQTALDPKFIEPSVVEAAKCRRQAAECADESKLRGDDVDHETQAGFLGKLEALLGFLLYVSERITRREKVRNQAVAPICSEREVPHFFREIEGATHEIAASSHMMVPWQDVYAERHIGAGLEALQPPLCNEVAAELPEPNTCLVVAKAPSGD